MTCCSYFLLKLPVFPNILQNNLIQWKDRHPWTVNCGFGGFTKERYLWVFALVLGSQSILKLSRMWLSILRNPQSLEQQHCKINWAVRCPEIKSQNWIFPQELSRDLGTLMSLYKHDKFGVNLPRLPWRWSTVNYQSLAQSRDRQRHERRIDSSYQDV